MNRTTSDKITEKSSPTSDKKKEARSFSFSASENNTTNGSTTSSTPGPSLSASTPGNPVATTTNSHATFSGSSPATTGTSTTTTSSIFSAKDRAKTVDLKIPENLELTALGYFNQLHLKPDVGSINVGNEVYVLMRAAAIFSVRFLYFVDFSD